VLIFGTSQEALDSSFEAMQNFPARVGRRTAKR